MKRRRFLIPVLLFVAAVSLRLWHLGKPSIWMDEGFSVWLASHSISDILSILKMDTHPPVFYLFLRFWFKAAGFNDFWLRVPFAIIGACNVLLVYGLIQKCADKRTALLTSAFWAVSLYALYMETQVRMYPLALFFSLAASSCFIEAYRNPTPKRSGLYLLFAALSIYTHYYTGLILLTHFLYLLITRRFKLFLGYLLALALVFSPWIPRFIFQVQNFTGWRGWHPYSLASLEFFSMLFGASLFQKGQLVNYFANLLGLSVTAVSAYYIVRYKSRQTDLLLMLFAVPLTLLIISYEWEITYVQWLRHIIFFAPYFYFLLAFVLIRLPRVFQVPLLALFFTMNLFSWYLFGTGPAYERQNWRAVTNFMRPRLEAGDAVWIEQALSAFPLWYYSHNQFQIRLTIRKNRMYIQLLPSVDVFWRIVGASTPDRDLASSSRRANKIWLVLCQEKIDDFREKVLGWLKRNTVLLLDQHYRSIEAGSDGDIRLFLFKPMQTKINADKPIAPAK